MNPIVKFLKALRALGLRKLWFYALYKVGLYSGHYRRLTPSKKSVFPGEPGLPPYGFFPELTKVQRDQVLSEADQIRHGHVRLFGTQWVPFEVEIGSFKKHWSELERIPPEMDIKFIWEPARFGWAFTLARAYAFSRDDLYAQDFWAKTLAFLEAHPPNLGWQWQSAQEVAIRLMALVFCDRVLAAAPSSTPEKRARLWQAIAEHAARIPPTMVYARAQNNNHLLAEAAGLYAAAVYLPFHPDADKWLQIGWRWLNWGFQHQITEFGTYNQHSVNYHRLVLQLALFVDQLRRESGDENWPGSTLARLEAGTRWLWALTDPKTGSAPNLGANDGAYIFPLTNQPFKDFRPVLVAAARAFLNLAIYPQPDLHEMADWFHLPAAAPADLPQPQALDMLRVESGEGCAFLRAAQFADRPSHADQLHVDLWWHDVNIAGDAGTYLYNASPPWDNTLAHTTVHNTLTLDGIDQMRRAGRFLWLDWAQGEVLAHAMGENGRLAWVTAEHNGYRHSGARHLRKLTAIDDGWLVADSVLSYGERNEKIHEVRLTWLLPDWEWTLASQDTLHLTGRDFAFKLQVKGTEQLNLVRAGKTLHGIIRPEPTWGWRSPTYGVKEPALMLLAVRSGRLPIMLQSTVMIIK